MKYTTSHLIRRTLELSRHYWPHIIGLFVLGLLATPIALLKPYALKLLIDCGLGSQEMPDFIKFFFAKDFVFSFEHIIIIVAVFYILVVFLDNIYVFISWVWSTFTGEKLVLNFRLLLFNHIQRLSLAYHDTKGASDSLYRIQWDTMSIRSFLLGQLSPLVSSTLTLIAMISIMFVINWQFALIAIAMIPGLVFFYKTLYKKIKERLVQSKRC